jgi:hypothetical protein
VKQSLIPALCRIDRLQQIGLRSLLPFCPSLVWRIGRAAAWLAVSCSLFAQALPFLSGSNGATRGASMMQGPSSQYPACTPADYGDPAAECIPANGRAAYSSYNPYDWTDSTTALPATPFIQSYPQYDRDTERERQPPATTPAHYEKEPPTEFQRYVAQSIGKILPIFGASLFEGVPATFAPVDRVPISSDYLIAPGDELQVSIWGQFNAVRRLIVSRSGDVVLPDTGPVAVAGMNYSQAAAELKRSLSRMYKNFDLSVTLGR